MPFLAPAAGAAVTGLAGAAGTAAAGVAGAGMAAPAMLAPMAATTVAAPAATGALWGLPLLPTLALGGMGLGAYMDYRGQMQQAKSQREWSEYQAKVAEQKAKAEEMAALYEARRLRERGETRKAAARAAYAKAGVVMAGSPVLALEDFETKLRMDELNLLRGGVVRAQKQRMGAEIERGRGAMAYQAGRAGAISSLFKGGMNMFMAGRSLLT